MLCQTCSGESSAADPPSLFSSTPITAAVPSLLVSSAWSDIGAWWCGAQVMESKGASVPDTPDAIAEFLNDTRKEKIARLVASYVEKFASTEG